MCSDNISGGLERKIYCPNESMSFEPELCRRGSDSGRVGVECVSHVPAALDET